MKNLNQISIDRSNSISIEALAEKSKPFKVPRMESITKTAEIFNIAVHFVRAAVANGDVVYVRAGRKFLVNCDSMAAFLSTGIPQGAASQQAAPHTENAPRIAPISLR